MLVLALDTAVPCASVVLAEDDREVAAWRADTHEDLCRRLAPQLPAVLSEGGRTFADLELVAVGLGPGSFTALRVGLATAKAVALARGVPLVGVSSLAAMVWRVRDRISGLACPMLDAKRGEAYAAVYRAERDGVEPVAQEFAAAPADLAKRLLEHPGPLILFGQVDRLPTEEIARLMGGRASVWRDEIIAPDALAIAQLGRRRFAASGPDDPASLRPIYVRMSYAEEHRNLDLGLR